MANTSSSNESAFLTFADFWQHYLAQHRHPVNQVFHVIGTVCGVICLALGLLYSWKWFLIALPIGYGGAWLGHFIFERNRPLTFTYPLWSLCADYLLVARLLTGRR